LLALDSWETVMPRWASRFFNISEAQAERSNHTSALMQPDTHPPFQERPEKAHAVLD